MDNTLQRALLGDVPEARFGVFVIEHRWWIMALTLILLAAFVPGVPKNHFTTNYRIYFGPENPQLLAFQALENTFNKTDNILIVLHFKKGNVYSKEGLAAVRDATERAWQIPNANRVDSLTNFQHTRARGDELLVGDLVPRPDTLTPADLARIRSVAGNEPLLQGRLVSQRGHATAISVTVQVDREADGGAAAAVAAGRALARDIEAHYADVEVRLGGVLMLDQAFEEMSGQDLANLFPISLGLMLILLMVVLRSFQGTLAILLVIVIANTIALGALGYSGIPMSSPTAVAPIIILTLCVASSVHLIITVLNGMSLGLSKRAAVIESMRVNLQPVSIASITTAIGFLSMNASEVPPFAHMGNVVAIGVLASLYLSLTFLPAILTLLPLQVRDSQVPEERWISALGDFVVARRRALLWCSAAVIVALIACVPRNEFNDVFQHYFDRGVEFRDDSDWISENLTGVVSIDYGIAAQGPGGVSDPVFMQQVDAFTAWLRQQPEVMHVSAYTDTMKRLNRNMHGDDPEYYVLPPVRELAAQYLLLYEMSLPYGLDLNNQMNVDKGSTRMEVRLHTITTNETLAFVERAAQWIERNARAIKRADATGTNVMFSHITQRNVFAMASGIVAALLLISALLVFALRSIKIGLISVIPNLVPAAMGFGIWGLFNGQVGLALSVVAGMTLGIVVDDTVHFLSKYLRARREKGFDPPRAVRYAFSTVGRAMLVTSIVLVLGFLVLALSDFRVSSQMGIMNALVIMLALLADFLFLPPLLMTIEEKRNAGKDDAVPSRRAA